MLVRRAGVVAFSVSVRAARSFALSRPCSSLSAASACSGVFVAVRRTTQAVRSGASKMVISGGGAVRFQNV